ncbi:hypothetical protein Cst_c02840 [Thermoclostridium stercorarium subsp. stercorarium DSM 8532]|uniref:Uncharacterized protein n=1 Tax=Thermoclostridium stercorarium (strain ATCC 35414 / DSM 8532 / NCIMB 11754) TaxID=1121335 RepID=L7VP34_THES1|nr:hypothetical protein Cst_c02840 [Thermoclostridium stercorarium subsp. stercorarium DSM 8532]
MHVFITTEFVGFAGCILLTAKGEWPLAVFVCAFLITRFYYG